MWRPRGQHNSVQGSYDSYEVYDFSVILEPLKSRMPGMSFSYIVKAEDGSLMKQETVSFHGPGRMIVEEAANDVAMITVYEKQT